MRSHAREVGGLDRQCMYLAREGEREREREIHVRIGDRYVTHTLIQTTNYVTHTLIHISVGTISIFFSNNSSLINL